MNKTGENILLLHQLRRTENQWIFNEFSIITQSHTGLIDDHYINYVKAALFTRIRLQSLWTR